jgi:hypothetical protein
MQKELTPVQMLVKACFENDVFEVNSKAGNFPILINWENLKKNGDIFEKFYLYISQQLTLSVEAMDMLIAVCEDGVQVAKIANPLIPTIGMNMEKKAPEIMINFNQSKVGVVFGYIKQQKNYDLIKKKIIYLKGNPIWALTLINFSSKNIEGVDSMFNYHTDIVEFLDTNREFALEQGLNTKTITSLRLFKEKWAGACVIPKPPKRMAGDIKIPKKSH